MSLPFCGVIPALLTPLDRNSAILIDDLRREADLLTDAGVDALCVGGPLGELSGASPAELEAACAAVRSGSSLPLVVNLFVDSTAEAIELSRVAQSSGAAAVLISQPHYLFQPDESGLLRQFSEIREAISVPVLLSNVLPSALVLAPTVRELYARSLIDGVYQGADPHVLADLLHLTPRIPVFAGVEGLLYIGLALGARGIISTMAAIFPRECQALRSAVELADHETARDIHSRLLNVWRTLDHPWERFARAKHALSRRGRPVGFARDPYRYVAPQSVVELDRALESFGT
jgi:4-hydroxy-tetrahydrodipicolinate synthase